MLTTGSSPSAESPVARCRRRIAALDRGWKATAIGVAIVAATALV